MLTASCQLTCYTLAAALLPVAQCLLTNRKERPLDANATALLGLFPEELDLMERNFESFRQSNPNGMLIKTNHSRQQHPLIFVHVHKSLGTWMCWLAHVNGARAPVDPDCAYKEDQIWARNDWNFFDFVNTCGRRQDTITQERLHFMEVERWVDFQADGIHGDWCPSLANYAIIMRHPIRRAKSQMLANKQEWSSVSEWLIAGETFRNPYGYVHSHIPYDNYYVRTLCGRKCHFLASGEIQRAHLEIAKEQLQRLDAVLVVDDLLSQVVQIEALTNWVSAGGTGIASGGAADKVIHNSVCVPLPDGSLAPDCMKYALSRDSEELLTRRNALDMELYEFAKTVAADKTRATLDARFG